MSEPAAAFRERILDERTAALAARRLAAPEVATTDHLVFTLGTDHFALPVAAVAAAAPPVPVGPLPGAPPALKGIARIAGRLAGVVDLARLLGLPAPAALDHVLLLRGATPLALEATRVLGVAALPDPPAAPSGDDLVVRVLRVSLAGDAEPHSVAVLAPARLAALVLPDTTPPGA